jgi:hypothetical protein
VDQGCYVSGRPDGSNNPTDVRRTACHPPLHPTVSFSRQHGGWPTDRRSPTPTVGWKADGRSIRRSAWRSAGRADGLADPSARAHLPWPSAQPKLWSPITIDLEVRFRRVIPFWNVQVMLYNIGYF